MAELTADRYYHALDDQAAQFAELVRGADLARHVPSCPEWDLAKLVEHVGQAHRWAATIVENRVAEPSQLPSRSEIPRLPEDPDERASWLPDGANRLAEAVRTAGVDCSVWNFAGAPRAGFWLRRMTHETAVHRADAALTLGVPFQLAPDLAADAITEWLELITSPGAAAARPEAAAALRGDGQTLHFHTTDEPCLGEAGEWMIRRAPDGVSWEHGHGKGDVAVRGAAADLLLVLMGRLPSTDQRLQILGDPDLLEHWVRHVAF